ncbi:MAG: amidohydrolase family protein, partial [Tissierellia bacterium]|nr:amidohydrolase family protein [Tissierellia bacterium]
MYDIVLRNGLIVDGTRSVPYIGSVGIIGDRIEDISRDKELVGKEEIDCTGLVISPGFIDLHTHSDACPLNDKSGESMVNQGVTLQIGGNCGISLIPATVENKDEISSFFARTVEIVPDDKNIDLYNMGDYISITNEKNQIINTGLLVGHGTLRAAVMGFDDRKANDEEMEAMKVLLDKELKGGAFGMSLGLIYPPSSYGDVEEFIELGKVIRDNEGIITTHMRDEGDGIFNSIDEMLEVAEKSGVHMHISHLKLMGTPQWGRSQEVLDKIDKAREKGAIITADQYPYEASATGLAALVPSWALSGGNTKMLERLEERSPELLKEIETIMNKRGGPSRVLIASTNGSSPEFDGKYISDISQEMNLDAVETVIQ